MRKILLLSFLFFWANAELAAQCYGPGSCRCDASLDLYWKGGNGLFNDTLKWDVGFAGSGITPCQVPRSTDNVFFTAGAFGAGAAVSITVDRPSACANMNWDAVMPRPVNFVNTNTTQTFDVYGDFSLAANSVTQPSTPLNFAFNGTLRLFSSRNGTVTINPRGQRFRLIQILVGDVLSNNTTFNFVDSLHVDDPNSTVGNYGYGGAIVLQNGRMVMNGNKIRTDFFNSTNGKNTRGLDISNCLIEIHGDNAYAWHWSIDFNATNPNPALRNYAFFNAAGSTIRGMAFKNISAYKYFNFGVGLKYNIFTCDAPALIYGNTANTGGLNYATMTLPSATFQADTFSVIRFNSRGQFGQTMNIVTDDLYLQPNETYSFIANYQSVLTVENIYRNPGCNELITLEVTPQSGTGTRGIINKKTAGTNLNLDYFVLNDVECNTAGGRTYTANNSIKLGYTPLSSVPFNWILNNPTRSAYYFVGSVLTTTATLPSVPNSYVWSNPANWRMYNPATGVLGVAATCVPSAIDDVYFGSASFPSYTYSTTISFNNAMHRLGQVQIDTIANCRSMYWLNDLKKGSSMSFAAPAYMSGATALRVYGSAWYNKKMNLGSTTGLPANANSGNTIYYYGVADTISGDSSMMLCTHYLMRYANYDIIGDLDTNTRDWTFYQLVGQGVTSMRTNFVQLNTTYRFYPNSRDMDSTQVYYITNGGYFTDNGGYAIYTGNTTFHFWGGLAPTPAATCNVDAGRMPNVIALCNMWFNTTYYQPGGKCEIQGDAFFAENASFYNTLNLPHYHYLDVNGAMALYDGNLTFSAGKTYEWAPNNTAPYSSRINVAGWLRGSGTCTQSISWRTLTGIPIPVTIGNTSTSNLNFFSIEGINNVGGTLTANNSIDIANNTNINFSTAGASRTYYWRAHYSRNPLHYTGNWSDPAYWSLNPLSLRGDSLCIPTIRDTVVFDTLSKPNATYALTDTCVINGLASCKVLWFKAGKNVRSTAQGVGRLTIDGSLLFDNNYTWLYNYSGYVYITGSGNIVTNNTQLKQPVTYFGKPGSTINFMDNITFSGSGLTPTQPTYGQVYLSAGTLNTNNNTVNVGVFFSTAANNEFKTINLGTSQVNLTGYYSSYTWYVHATTLNTVSAVNSTINFKVPPTAYNYMRGGYFGVGYNYGNVNYEDPNNVGEFQGSCTFKYVTFAGSANFGSNNTFDSLFFSAGKTYRLAQNTTQTLRAPYGKIIANGTNSNYINIETPTSGVPLTAAQRSKFYKPFGTSFCVYFVRVKENEAYTNTTATIPSTLINGVNWQAYNVNFPLWFQTDFNSDNVNGTAINRWDFTLPVDFNPTITGSTSFTLCAWAADQTVTLPIYGNAPYILSKTWTNTFGQSGIHTDTVPDNDNNPNTPFNYQLTITQPAATTTFNILLNTVRCGVASTPLPVGVTVTMPNPNTLVDVDRTKSCVLNNSPAWFTFLDPVNSKPMVSIQDKVNAADNVALGNVDTEVRFTPTVQYLPSTSACYANAPYLQRYWHITPANNSQANVRLYFTTAELTYLTYRTPIGATRLLDVATEIKVLKYPSGVVGVGACQEMTHTVVNWNPSTTSPFTSTSGVIGVEFPVSSFSAFVIVPTTVALLSLQITSFDAQLNNRKTVDVSWTTALEENMSHFVVERSKDGFSFEEIGRTPARNNVSNNYTFEDKNPQVGFNYYRVRGVDNSQAYTLTDTRAVELKGAAILDVFPNPVNNELNVRLFSNNQTDVQMQVIDALGRVLIEQNVTKNAGQEQFQLNTSRLSAGMYILRLTDAAGNLQQVRFVKE